MHFCCLCFRTNRTGSIQIIIQLQSNSSGFCKRQKYVKTMSMSAKRLENSGIFKTMKKTMEHLFHWIARPNAQHYSIL